MVKFTQGSRSTPRRLSLAVWVCLTLSVTGAGAVQAFGVKTAPPVVVRTLPPAAGAFGAATPDLGTLTPALPAPDLGTLLPPAGLDPLLGEPGLLESNPPGAAVITAPDSARAPKRRCEIEPGAEQCQHMAEAPDGGGDGDCTCATDVCFDEYRPASEAYVRVCEEASD